MKVDISISKWTLLTLNWTLFNRGCYAMYFYLNSTSNTIKLIFDNCNVVFNKSTNNIKTYTTHNQCRIIKQTHNGKHHTSPYILCAKRLIQMPLKRNVIKPIFTLIYTISDSVCDGVIFLLFYYCFYYRIATGLGSREWRVGGDVFGWGFPTSTRVKMGSLHYCIRGPPLSERQIKLCYKYPV